MWALKLKSIPRERWELALIESSCEYAYFSAPLMKRKKEDDKYDNVNSYNSNLSNFIGYNNRRECSAIRSNHCYIGDLLNVQINQKNLFQRKEMTG